MGDDLKKGGYNFASYRNDERQYGMRDNVSTVILVYKL